MCKGKEQEHYVLTWMRFSELGEREQKKSAHCGFPQNVSFVSNHSRCKLLIVEHTILLIMPEQKYSRAKMHGVCSLKTIILVDLVLLDNLV